MARLNSLILVSVMKTLRLFLTHLGHAGIAIVSKFAAPNADAPEQDQSQQWCAVEGSPFWSKEVHAFAAFVFS